MYDDPSVNPQTTYDVSHGADHGLNGSDGLYDEPAFNANVKKMNPLYNSHEDLAAASGAHDQGAAAAAGDGYLDVSPKTELVEDAGYLEQEAPAAPASAKHFNQVAAPAASYDNPAAFGFGAAEPQYASAVEEPQAEYEAAPESAYADADVVDAE